MADNPGLPLDPRLQANMLDLYGMSTDRIARQQPIHEAAMAMAKHMAPDYAQAAMGPTPTRTDPSTLASSLGTNGSGGGKSGLNAGLAAGLGALLAGLAKNGSGGDIGKLLKDIKDWFNRRKGPGHVDNSNWLASYDPFNSNNDWNGMTPDHSGLGGGDNSLTPNVTTDWNIDPNSLWNLLNEGWTGPSDPSGGTGVGPGMQGYRGGDGSGAGGGNWWEE